MLQRTEGALHRCNAVNNSFKFSSHNFSDMHINLHNVNDTDSCKRSMGPLLTSVSVVTRHRATWTTSGVYLESIVLLPSDPPTFVLPNWNDQVGLPQRCACLLWVLLLELYACLLPIRLQFSLQGTVPLPVLLSFPWLQRQQLPLCGLPHLHHHQFVVHPRCCPLVH